MPHKDPAKKAAYQAENKEKIAAQKATYQAENKEKIAASHAAYYAENKEKIAASHAAYYAENKEKFAARCAAYRAKNKEKLAAYQVTYYAENKEKGAAKSARRRAFKFQATPAWADHEKIAAVYSHAADMSTLVGDAHVDHIYPLKGKFVRGLHVHQNLRVMYGPENCAKSNKVDAELLDWVLHPKKI
jgi:hypothetical protein